MEKGLYGALIVRAADELALDGEQILILDDLRVDNRGQIAKFGGLMDRHNGREGNVRLINGTSEPEFAIVAPPMIGPCRAMAQRAASGPPGHRLCPCASARRERRGSARQGSEDLALRR